jgi:hypothetical protein
MTVEINIKDDDLFGRFYLKAKDTLESSPEDYYRTIDTLRPLLREPEFTRTVSGYYLNFAGQPRAMRFSYFTKTPQRARDMLYGFCRENGLIESALPEPAQPHEVSGAYGGQEQRFRIFLYLYTLIGLDIMESDLLNARCLMATYRWQVMIYRNPARPHFEKTFQKQSSAYNMLATAQKNQFWKDLQYWPNPPQVDWAHMMVNMVLPGDWNKRKGDWTSFLNPHEPLKIEDINPKLTELGFQIPLSWRPRSE